MDPGLENNDWEEHQLLSPPRSSCRRPPLRVIAFARSEPPPRKEPREQHTPLETMSPRMDSMNPAVMSWQSMDHTASFSSSSFTLQPRNGMTFHTTPERGRKRRAIALASTPPHSLHDDEENSVHATLHFQGLSLFAAQESPASTHGLSFGSNHSAFQASPSMLPALLPQSSENTTTTATAPATTTSVKVAPKTVHVKVLAGGSPSALSTPLPHVRLTPRSSTTHSTISSNTTLWRDQIDSVSPVEDFPQHPLSFLPHWDGPARSLLHPPTTTEYDDWADGWQKNGSPEHSVGMFADNDEDDDYEYNEDTDFILTSPSALPAPTSRKELRLAPSETSLFGISLVPSSSSLPQMDREMNVRTPPAMPYVDSPPRLGYASRV